MLGPVNGGQRWEFDGADSPDAEVDPAEVRSGQGVAQLRRHTRDMELFRKFFGFSWLQRSVTHQ
jgi:hypothetical protein